MKFTSNKSIFMVCLTFGLAGSAQAADWRSYLNLSGWNVSGLKSYLPETVRQYLPAEQVSVQPAATVVPVPEPARAVEPVGIVDVARPYMPPSPAASSAGFTQYGEQVSLAQEDQPDSPARAFSETTLLRSPGRADLSAFQAAAQKSASAKIRELFPGSYIAATETGCLGDAIQTVSDQIERVKNMWKLGRRENEIETKVAMQESVLQLLYLKKELISKLPVDDQYRENWLQDVKEEIDYQRSSMPFHKRKLEGKSSEIRWLSERELEPYLLREGIPQPKGGIKGERHTLEPVPWGASIERRPVQKGPSLKEMPQRIYSGSEHWPALPEHAAYVESSPVPTSSSSEGEVTGPNE
jgi:hypothetical protein